jgi:hypothetical protein
MTKQHGNLLMEIDISRFSTPEWMIMIAQDPFDKFHIVSFISTFDKHSEIIKWCTDNAGNYRDDWIYTRHPIERSVHMSKQLGKTFIAFRSDDIFVQFKLTMS